MTTIRIGLLLILGIIAAYGQTQTCGTVALNPVTGRLDCLGTPGSPNFKFPVTTTSTTFSIPATQHKNTHSALIVACYDSASPAVPLVFVRSAPAAGQFAYSVDPTTFAVGITFTSGGNNGGYCTVNGAGQGLAGQTGPTGATGSAGTIAVGTVSAIGPNATPTVVNSGSGTAATLNFGLPRAPNWLVASGVPASGTGLDGDVYLDSATGTVYGPKSSGSWGASSAIIKGTNGSAGPAGKDAGSCVVIMTGAQRLISQGSNCNDSISNHGLSNISEVACVDFSGNRTDVPWAVSGTTLAIASFSGSCTIIGGGNGIASVVTNYRTPAISGTGTFLTIPQTAHLNAHSALITECYTSSGTQLDYKASSPGAGQYSATVSQTAPYDVSVLFGTGGNNGGYCTVNGSGQGIKGLDAGSCSIVMSGSQRIVTQGSSCNNGSNHGLTGVSDVVCTDSGGSRTDVPWSIFGTTVTIAPFTGSCMVLGAGNGASGVSGSGTVTSVGATFPTWLTVSGSPVTSSGTLAVTAATGQTANQILATPNGTTGAVALRSLVAADIPASLSSTTSVNGTTIPGSAALAVTGVDINASSQVTATHLASALPVAQGGTGTTSTLTGIVRGGSPMTASELTGDVSTSGSNATTLVSKYKTRTCEVHIWGSGASRVLQDADDEAASCYNDFGVTETVAAVRCYANAGSPTVTPIVTGGGSTSILSSALTCGTASWASGTLNGTPTLSAGSTIDANVTTAGGTATNIRIVVTLTR